MPGGLNLILRHLNRQPEPLHSDIVHLESAMAWLMRAQDVTRSGGVAGLYSILRGWFDAYPETTGYIIQTFVDFHIMSNDEVFLSRAIAMADWEIDVQLPNGAVRGSCLKRGLSKVPLVFDTGQVILGWLSLYRITRELRYLQAALRASLWISENQAPDGIWHEHVYRQHCGTYHSRVAWALLQAANEAQRDDLRAAALSFIDWTISQQNSLGFFTNTGFRPSRQHFTHAIAYTLEGLIGASEEIADTSLQSKMMQAVIPTCERLSTLYLRTNILYGAYNPDFTPATTYYRCVTGTAQLARCYLKVYRYTKNERFLTTAFALIDEVKSMQIQHTGDSDLAGGIPGSYPLWGAYQRWRFVTWGAKFLVDALIEKRRSLPQPIPDLRNKAGS